VSDGLSQSSDLSTSPLSAKAKFQQAASFLFITGGLALMGWGGWLFYQQQAEASKPPPAPIVDSAVVFAATYTAQETPSPTASPILEVTVSTETKVAAPPSQRKTATPTPAVSPTSAATDATGPLSVVDVAHSMASNPLLALMGQETDFLANLPVKTVDTPLTRLVAESIELDTPVTGVGWTEIVRNGTPIRVWTVAEKAAGWHQNSLLPGQGGNIVLSGHHNIRGEVFRHIVDLKIGDTITLYMGDQPYNYIVNDKFIVKDKGEPEEVRLANARWIGPFEDERVTLITCWPYTNNTHRVIVIAKPTEAPSLHYKFPGLTVEETLPLNAQE